MLNVYESLHKDRSTGCVCVSGKLDGSHSHFFALHTAGFVILCLRILQYYYIIQKHFLKCFKYTDADW